MATANSSPSPPIAARRFAGDPDRHFRGGRPLDRRLAALRATRELAHCSDRQVRSLLPHVDEIAVPAGSRIAVEQQPCVQFLIVVKGRLRADSRDGAPRALCPGDSHGWTAMWERAASDSTVVAESDSRLLVMGHAQFRAAKAVAARPTR